MMYISGSNLQEFSFKPKERQNLVVGKIIGAHITRPVTNLKATLPPFVESQIYLIDPSPNGLVENARDKQRFHVRRLDVELDGDEVDLDPRVGLDELDQDLGTDVPEEVLDVLPDEGVVHDGLPVLLEDLLEVVDVVVLVGGHQVCHGEDLRIVLVGLGLLRVERVDAGLHEHVGEDEVLQTGRAPGTAGLIVVLEGLEEVGVGLLELGLAEVHFPATFSNHSWEEKKNSES